MARPWHLIRLGAEFINRAVGQLFWYVCLSPPNVLLYGVYSCGLYCRHHWGIFPLPTRPTCFRHPHYGTPARPWAFSISPPSSNCLTIAPTETPPYTSSHIPASFLPSSSSPSWLYPIAYALSSGSDIPPANRCCCRQLSAQGRIRPPTVAGTLHWSGTMSYLPQSSAVASRIRVAATLPVCSSQMYSVGCLVSTVGLGSRSAHTWGDSLGVPVISQFYPPSYGF